MGMNKSFRLINMILFCEREPKIAAEKIINLEDEMGRVKEALLERPFKPEQEGIYSLAKRLLREIEIDLSYPDISESYRQELEKLKKLLKEVIENENTDCRVQQSSLQIF